MLSSSPSSAALPTTTLRRRLQFAKVVETLRRSHASRLRMQYFSRWRLYVVLKAITSLNFTGMSVRAPSSTVLLNGGGPCVMTLQFKNGGKKSQIIKKKVMSSNRIYSTQIGTPPATPVTMATPAYSGLAVLPGQMSTQTANSYENPDDSLLGSLQREVDAMYQTLESQKRAIDMRDRMINDLTRQRDLLVGLLDSDKDSDQFGDTTCSRARLAAQIASLASSSTATQPAPSFVPVAAQSSGEESQVIRLPPVARSVQTSPVDPFQSVAAEPRMAASPVIPSPPVSTGGTTSVAVVRSKMALSASQSNSTGNPAANGTMRKKRPSVDTVMMSSSVALESGQRLEGVIDGGSNSAAHGLHKDVTGGGQDVNRNGIRASAPSSTTRSQSSAHPAVQHSAAGAAAAGLTISSIVRPTPAAANNNTPPTESAPNSARPQNVNVAVAMVCSAPPATNIGSVSLPSSSRKLMGNVNNIRGLAILPQISAIAGGGGGGAGSQVLQNNRQSAIPSK